MLRIRLITLLIIFQSINVYSQISTLKFVTDSVIYIAGNVKYIQTDFIFTNTTDDWFVLWLDENNNDSLDNEQRIRKYFSTYKGDFTITQLLYETLAEEPLPQLYLSFYKIIAPGSQFTISILVKKNYNAYEKLIRSVNKQIVTINSKELTIPSIEDLKRFNYKAKSIAITGDKVRVKNN